MRINPFSPRSSRTEAVPDEGLPQVQVAPPKARTGNTFPADEVVWGVAIREGFDEIDDPFYHKGMTQHAYLEGNDAVALCGFRPPRSGPRTRRRTRLGLPTSGDHPMCGICARMVVVPTPRVPIPVQPGKPAVAIPVTPARVPVPAATSSAAPTLATTPVAVPQVPVTPVGVPVAPLPMATTPMPVTSVTSGPAAPTPTPMPVSVPVKSGPAAPTPVTPPPVPVAAAVTVGLPESKPAPAGPVVHLNGSAPPPQQQASTDARLSRAVELAPQDTN